MKSSVVIIPARMGSTRLPNKPMSDICGKSLIVRVFEMAKKSNIGEVVVACDHQDIKNAIESIGGVAYMTSPDFECGTDRIYDVYQRFYSNYDYIVNLQGDMINITAESLKKIIKNTIDGQIDIGTAVKKHNKNDEIIHKAQNVKAILSIKNNDNNFHKAIYFTRSVAPFNAEDYFIHCGIYVYKKDSIELFIRNEPSYLEKVEKLEQLRALEMNLSIYATVINDNPISIDTPEDLDYAKRFIKNNY